MTYIYEQLKAVFMEKFVRLTKSVRDLYFMTPKSPSVQAMGKRIKGTIGDQRAKRQHLGR